VILLLYWGGLRFLITKVLDVTYRLQRLSFFKSVMEVPSHVLRVRVPVGEQVVEAPRAVHREQHHLHGSRWSLQNNILSIASWERGATRRARDARGARDAGWVASLVRWLDFS
jgi:hypothetical protein